MRSELDLDAEDAGTILARVGAAADSTAGRFATHSRSAPAEALRRRQIAEPLEVFYVKVLLPGLPNTLTRQRHSLVWRRREIHDVPFAVGVGDRGGSGGWASR